jgi:uncharacterized membrane protein YdjX (TVP38/TMEM64 family)
METLSVVAGLAGMRRGRFLIASLAGTTPAVIVYAYAGAFSREIGSVIPAAAVMGVVLVIGWFFYRWRRAVVTATSS